jgi:hypothetical protein
LPRKTTNWPEGELTIDDIELSDGRPRPSATATVLTAWVHPKLGHVLASKSALLFASILAIHSAIALAVGESAWDDGYITLAFARTFAETGHIGLTPFSETVEGATSPAWFLLMAGIYALGVTGFYGLHLASQLLASVCAAVAAVLLYRLIRPSAPGSAWWMCFVAMLLGPLRAETANGMEMTLLCVVVLAIMLALRDCHRQPLWGLAVLSAVIPWIRLEVVGYTVMGAIAIVVLSRQYRVGLAIIGSCLLSVLTLTVVRYLIFGEVGLTNTMIAKGLSPYSPPFGTPAWTQQFLYSTVVEPAITVLPAIAIGLFLLHTSGTAAKEKFRQVMQSAKSRELPARISFGAAYAVAYIGFILVLGSNYFNRPGRMGASAMLALIAVAVLAVPATKAVRPPKLRHKAAAGALFLVPCLGIAADDLAWIYIGRLGSDETLASHSTIAYRKNGEAMEHVRDILGRPVVSALFADVGAASLCCQNIEVLDLGLLANRDLSRTGWDQFPSYLVQKKPDLIQTHGVWSQESGIYEDPYFQRNYSPVVVYGSLFFLRDDHFRSVQPRCVAASVTDPYFYSGWEALSSKKKVRDVAVIDDDYLDSLHLDNICRLP